MGGLGPPVKWMSDFPVIHPQRWNVLLHLSWTAVLSTAEKKQGSLGVRGHGVIPSTGGEKFLVSFSFRMLTEGSVSHWLLFRWL